VQKLQVDLFLRIHENDITRNDGESAMSAFVWVSFLADRTNSRAYTTVLRPSSSVVVYL